MYQNRRQKPKCDFSQTPLICGWYRSIKNTIYLRRLGDGRDVRFDAYRPVQMEFVLVELEQEHDEHEQGVDHEKREHRFVPEFYQVRSDPSSFVFVVVDWVQIFVDQISPELLFGHRQERHRALPQWFVFDPVRIDVIVPFHSGF